MGREMVLATKRKENAMETRIFEEKEYKIKYRGKISKPMIDVYSPEGDYLGWVSSELYLRDFISRDYFLNH